MESDIAGNNIPGIIDGIIAIAENEEGADYAEDICIRLSNHENGDVRATAILGFGYIARTHGRLKDSSIKEIVNRGVRSTHDLERTHSESARADIEHFLGWCFKE